jgi:hypothetical protein
MWDVSCPTTALCVAGDVTGSILTGTSGGTGGGGYDLVGADGGVFAFGSPGLGYYNSLPGIGVHIDDIVGMASTADGKGYWMAGRDGGVFAFGDANFAGSLASIGVHVDDIVGMAADPVTGGYWLVASDGGYRLVASDGGIFAFGDAAFEGSLPGNNVAVTDVVGAAPAA